MAGQSAAPIYSLASQLVARPDKGQALDPVQDLEKMSAESRIRWALDNLPGRHVMSSSFGIQSAVLLHMVTTIRPDMDVILVDTGYLFDETYRFIEELTERLDLNLKVYQAAESPREQEERYGQLWKQGKQGLEKYNRINKVEPMNRALQETGAGTWITGLRRQQSSTREDLAPIQLQDGRYKLLPIVDWTNRDIYQYLKKHDLPYHPLWEKGYVSVGDTHTSEPLQPGMTEEQTRFFGIQRECGLHTHSQPASAA